MAKKKAVQPADSPHSVVIKKIRPVSERDERIAALIYGRSGTGKTALSSTFPRPALLLDVKEHGTDTIAKVPDVDILRVDDWATFEQAWWFLKDGDHKYETVIIDQVTQVQSLAIDQLKSDEGMGAEDPLARRDWGTVSSRVTTWLFNYRDLIEHNLHVVMLAHERAIAGDDSGEEQLDPSVGPRLMPSVASAINGAVSVIGHTFIRERFVGDERKRVVEYCMRLGPHSYYTTKVRHPIEAGTPDVLVNPTYQKMMAVIKGERRPATKKVKRKK